MINTFNLLIQFHGYSRYYKNISRVAVEYFIDYHSKNPDYLDYAVTEN